MMKRGFGGESRATVAKIATATLTKTADATLEVVPGLVVNVNAGASYAVHAVLRITCSTAGLYKVAVHGTAAGTGMFMVEHIGTSSFVWDSIGDNVGYQVSDTPFGGAETQYLCRITGGVSITVAGTLEIRFAQSASNATPSTVTARSPFIVSRV
jgi:hypothetical protein